MKKYKKMKLYKHLNDFEMVQKIIESGADINKLDRKTKRHALFFALENDVSMEVLDLLVRSGSELNRQDKEGNSVIHICQDLKKLEYLILAGADLNLVNKKSHTPIFGCVDHNKVAMLVDHGIDLNVCDKDGQHFLKSVYASDFDLMKIYIDKGLSRFLEKKGLTLDAFIETWSTREVQTYYENKLTTEPELFKLKR